MKDWDFKRRGYISLLTVTCIYRTSAVLHPSENIVLGPVQNLVPIGVTKHYCDFQLDNYMRGLKMYEGLFRTVA